MLELPFIAVALLVVALTLWPQAQDLDGGSRLALHVFDVGVTLLFVGELVVMLYLAPSPWFHIRRRWYDVVVVLVLLLTLIPVLTGVRWLGFLRALRSTKLLKAFKAGKVAGIAGALRFVLQRHGLQYLLGVGAVLYVCMAGMVVMFERDASGATIRGFPEALWWGVTTVTSVDEGRYGPVTTGGRAMGVMFAVLGLTLLSIITANIAAFLLHSEERDHERRQTGKLDQVLTELDEIRKRLG